MILSGINLVMTVIGFAVSTMFIVFVCTRLICARIHLSSSRRSFRTATGSDLSNLERGLYGLEPAVVTGFPTQKFGDQCFSSGQDTQCTICLAEYQDEDVLRLLPFCGHAFHVACIDLWLKQHSTCPLCRISLRDSPDRKCTMEPVYSSPIGSLYPPETSSLELYHFLHAVHVDSARIADNQRLETTREDQFISEPSGAMEAASPEVNCSSKITCPHGSEKYMKSPLNP